MYFQRTLEAFFRRASDQFPVMLVTGARQVGKTTFLRHLATKNRVYVTLDDPQLLSLAKADPALFLQRFPPPVLIDEIQYAPELLPHIKMMVDANRRAGQFWLTGSQQFHLMKGVSESLAGRVGVVQLLGLSHREGRGDGGQISPFLPITARLAEAGKAEALSLQPLYQAIWRGSFPAMVLNPEMDRNLFYQSYVQTYLQRDVRDLAKVGDEMAFLRFLRAAAARSAGLLNLADLARDASIAPNTAKSWLSILQTSGIVHLLEPYHNNRTQRLVQTPKLYFLDTGLCAWLTAWSSPETLEAGAFSGAIFETWVVGEVLKSWLHNGLQPPLYFYRDKDQKEIDLLIVQDGIIHPLEIKKSSNPGKDAVRQFKTLANLNQPMGPGGVICLAGQTLPLTESTTLIPVHLI